MVLGGVSSYDCQKIETYLAVKVTKLAYDIVESSFTKRNLLGLSIS